LVFFSAAAKKQFFAEKCLSEECEKSVFLPPVFRSCLPTISNQAEVAE
jgi:hypothetical protein